MAGRRASAFGSSASSWRRLIGPAARALRAGRLRSIALGPVAGLLIALCAEVQHLWHPAILTYSASTPWLAALVRLPVSVVSPAQSLPAWGAIAQTVIGLSVAQAVLGLRRTLVVGLGAHILATLVMRLLVHVAAGDVPTFWLHETDCGPSVAVLSTLVATGIVARASWLSIVAASGTVLEVSVLHNQAGVEHLAGITVGLALGLVWRPASMPGIISRRRSDGFSAAPTQPAAPAIEQRRSGDTAPPAPTVPGRQTAAA